MQKRLNATDSPWRLIPKIHATWPDLHISSPSPLTSGIDWKIAEVMGHLIHLIRRYSASAGF